MEVGEASTEYSGCRLKVTDSDKCESEYWTHKYESVNSVFVSQNFCNSNWRNDSFDFEVSV